MSRDYRRTGKPSKLENITHIWAFAPGVQENENIAPGGGKWCIYSSTENIDRIWEIIKTATNERKLGNISKVSSKGLAHQYKSKEHVICVYTSVEDKNKIFNELQTLKLNCSIRYVSNKKYEKQHEYNPDKYWEKLLNE